MLSLKQRSQKPENWAQFALSMDKVFDTSGLACLRVMF
jgi:hypothetical protein